MEHANPKSLTIEVIDEYLEAAKACLETTKSDGGCLGYPAALLLLCITDAIGHLMPKMAEARGPTRLEVLSHFPFNVGLTNDQITDLKKFYRNSLSHNAGLGEAKFLQPQKDGPPFIISEAGKLAGLRVFVFYSVVQAAWEKVKPKLDHHTPHIQWEQFESGGGSTETQPASGWVRLSKSP